MSKNTKEHPAATAIKSILSAYPEFDVSTLCYDEKHRLRKLLSTEESIVYLGGISRMSLWRLVNRTKEIKPVFIGSRQMFDIEDLDELIRNRKMKSLEILEERNSNGSI